MTVAALIGYGLEALFGTIRFGWIGTVVVASILLAGRSLYDHVAAVADAFSAGLPAARSAVSRIVGRDPGSLDEPRICRAAIESTAENFSDGVVAPAIWFLLLGLPGLLAYKAINTADSMIGHLTPRHQDFGWAAARLDDLVNLPASRLAGALIALAAPAVGGQHRAGVPVMVRDARKPPLAQRRLAGGGDGGRARPRPRRPTPLRRHHRRRPFLNAAGRRDANSADIRRALRVYLGAKRAVLRRSSRRVGTGALAVAGDRQQRVDVDVPLEMLGERSSAASTVAS